MFGTDKWKTDVHALARKSIRDHERFLAHFDQVSPRPLFPSSFLLSLSRETGISDLSYLPFHSSSQMESLAIHFDQTTLEELRADRTGTLPLNPRVTFPNPSSPTTPSSQTFTTYHPLLVESHYSILLCHLLLGDFPAVLTAYNKIAHLVDGLEGYPVFLPARSMAQAEFVEILERLLGGWRYGLTPGVNGRGTRAILPKPEEKKEGWTDGVSPAVATSEVKAPVPILASASSSAASTATILASEPSGSGSRSSTPSSSSGGRHSPSHHHHQQTNGSSSSTPAPPPPRAPTPQSTGRDAPPPVDLPKSLDAVRQLIVQAGIKAKERQQKTAEKVAEAKRMGKPAGFGSINIPLSGPRVEVRHFTRLRCVWFR